MTKVKRLICQREQLFHLNTLFTHTKFRTPLNMRIGPTVNHRKTLQRPSKRKKFKQRG